MFYPRLKVRPRSTHTVYRFGGLMHNDEAPVGMTNGTTMRWYDERNLGHDKAPMLSVRPSAAEAADIDGNQGYAHIIGWCGGEHPVLLDELGLLWCNGQSFPLLQILDPILADVYASVDPQITITFDGSATVTNQVDLIDLCYTQRDLDAGYLRRKSVVFTYIGNKWNYLHGGNPVAIDEIPGITVDGTPGNMDKITIAFVPYYAMGGIHNLVRMGAFVIDARIGAFVNVEELAAGKTMTLNENYGFLGAWQLTTVDNSGMRLELCRIDGTPYTGAIASATEPTSHTSVWIDTSGANGAVVREWSASVSTWIVIPSTYVKLSPVHVGWESNLEHGVIRTGDGVQFTAYGLDDNTDRDVQALLASSHVLIEAKDEGLGTGYVIVPGVLPSAVVHLTSQDLEALYISREAPEMDYIVEAQNRLWGCRYGTTDDGKLINEIYASKLGDPRNWSVFEGLSTDSWTASRGTPAPFTGAAVLSGHPLFFREDSLEKVYPSSAGAHQIQTFSLDGVEQGSADSLVVIDERLYYKSRLGICVYDGTMPRLISGAFGDMVFRGGSAARHKKQYVVAMTATDGERIAANYDTQTGEWHLETGGWIGTAITWKDDLLHNGEDNDVNAIRRYTSYETNRSTEWYAESGVIGYELPEHRFISCVRIRLRQLQGDCSMTVKIKYQDTEWLVKGTIAQTEAAPDTREINIFPRRCDHFRLRLEGKGLCEILSLSFRMERSEGGH